jgi:fibronectin-binding autotransporter adhesin
VLPNTPGPLGSASSPITLSAVSGTSARLLLNGAYVFFRDVAAGATGTGATTVGGATADVSYFNGAMVVSGPVNLTAAAGGVVHFAGPISSSASASVAKTGAGTVVLEAANTYVGPTSVTGGTLLVNSLSGSATGSGNVSVNGGTLAGLGSISGDVSVGDGGAVQDSFLAPGLPLQIGTLRMAGLALLSDGSFLFEFN